MITLSEVLISHEIKIEKFGGGIRVRDMDLLESSIQRPNATFDGKDLYPNAVDKASAIIESIVKNHPFSECNKRTGYILMRLMLLKSKMDILATEWKFCKYILFLLFLIPNFCFGQNSQYDSLIILADHSYDVKNFKLAAEQYNVAFNDLGRKGRPEDRFKAAIAWTLIGEKDSAFFNLFRLAEKTNYLEFHILNFETRFQFLRSDSRWNELLYLVNPRNETYNDSLAKILLKIRENDQKYRLMLDAMRRPYNEEPTDSFKAILKTMNYYDSINLIKVKLIIDRYGWLSQNEVGNKGNSTLWLVIQHSDLKTQEKYFPTMKEAVKNGKATKSELAYLEDRILMNQGKKQLYGTQYRLNETNKQMELWLIEDPLNLNKRRESVGLPPL